MANRFFLFAVGGSLLMQLLVVYWYPLQYLFDTTPVSVADLLQVRSYDSVFSQERLPNTFSVRRSCVVRIIGRRNKEVLAAQAGGLQESPEI